MAVRRTAADTRGRRVPRLVTGLLVALLLPPLLTVVLVGLRPELTLSSDLLLYLVAVVLVAAFGSVLAAVLAALLSGLLANYFFTLPLHSLAVRDQDTVLDLVVFVVVAVAVSVTVDLALRGREAAARSRVEAELLGRLAAQPVAESSVAGVLEQVRANFAMSSVSLVRAAGPDEAEVLATVGTPADGIALDVEAGPGVRLSATGPQLFAEDRRVLARLAAAAARAWETEQLAEQARQAAVLADVDRLRTALLAAVGHDLRTPLAGIKAAVSALREPDLALSAADRGELLAGIDDGADELAELVENLLAMSRLTAGALSVRLEPVRLDEAVGRLRVGRTAGGATAVRGATAIGGGTAVRVDVPDDLPSVRADPGLLGRVLANLVGNAVRFSPAARPVEVTAVPVDGEVLLAVVDHGPGVPEPAQEQMFAPFQRLDDTSGDGLGLGLAIARGFAEAMGARLTPATTPGGGLTMRLALPVVEVGAETR